MMVVVGTALALAAAGAGVRSQAQSAPTPASTPGTLIDGSTMLANGWRLGPAGRHITVGTFPINIVQSPDSRYLIISNNGLAKPSFTIVDASSWIVKQTVVLDQA